MLNLKFVLCLFFLVLSQPVSSTDQALVFTVDMNKLLKLSNFGQDLIRRNNLARLILQNENEVLEAELLSEEKVLSDLRKSLSLDDFRAKAIEFDKKVTIIRSEQSKKEDALIDNIRREEANFYKNIYPLLYQLISDLGGSILIDQRNVVLWNSSVDITEDAIVIINQVLDKNDGNSKNTVE